MSGATIATGGAAAPLVLWIGRAAHLSTKAVLLAEEAIPESGAGVARAAYAAQHVAESPDTKQILADLREMLGKDANPEEVDDFYESLNETGHKLAKLLGALEKKASGSVN